MLKKHYSAIFTRFSPTQIQNYYQYWRAELGVALSMERILDFLGFVAEYLACFGRHDEITKAVDEMSRQELKNLRYCSYKKNGKYSIEINKKRVSSNQITFEGPATSQFNDTYALDRFP